MDEREYLGTDAHKVFRHAQQKDLERAVAGVLLAKRFHLRETEPAQRTRRTFHNLFI